MSMSPPRLRDLPFNAKLLVTSCLAFMALNHVFGGCLAWQIAHSAAGSAKEHFQYKSLIYLLRMSHQHAFGYGVMYAISGGLFLLSTWPERSKTALVLAPFLGALADLASWWMLKYWAGDYEWLSIAGGMMFAIGFTVMTVRIFYELWLQGEKQE